MNQSLIASWQESLDTSTKQFLDAFSDLSLEELNWKANPDYWSIGQVIDHLITTNQQYHPIFDQVLEGSYKSRLYERLPLLPALFGKMILNSVQPQTSRKTKTVPVFEPSTSDIPFDILVRFQSSQEVLGGYLTRLAELPLSSIIITSPASKIVIYSLSSALEIIVAHEQRHYLQAQNILQQARQA